MAGGHQGTVRTSAPRVRTCSYKGCNRPHSAKGWCAAHYQQWARGQPIRKIKGRPIVRKACSYASCGRLRMNRHALYCAAHSAMVEAGKPLRDVDVRHQRLAPCLKRGCSEPAVRKGLCGPHYTASLPPCAFNGCAYPAHVVGSGLCRGHDNMQRRGEELRPILLRKAPETCTVQRCAAEHFRGGLCYAHYMGSRPTCTVPRCGRPAVSSAITLCPGHRRMERRGEALRPIERKRPVGVPCRTKGCELPAVSRGWCLGHWRGRFPKCAYKGCERRSRTKRKGLCEGHANMRKRGEPLRPLSAIKKAGGPCAVQGCDAASKHLDGLCAKHHAEQLPPCAFPDCGRRSRTHRFSLCQTHDEMRKRGETLRPIPRRGKKSVKKQVEAPPCGFQGCGASAEVGGLCPAHYQQKRQGRQMRLVRRQSVRVCKVPSCTDRAAHRDGLCTQHHVEALPFCAFPDCGRRVRSPKQTMCQGHGLMEMHGLPLRPLGKGGKGGRRSAATAAAQGHLRVP